MIPEISDEYCIQKIIELIERDPDFYHLYCDLFGGKYRFGCEDPKVHKNILNNIEKFLFNHGVARTIVRALVKERLIHRLGIPPRYRSSQAYVDGYYESMNPNRTFIQQQTNDLLRKMVVRSKPLDVLKDILE